jgi:hypothetical protein
MTKGTTSNRTSTPSTRLQEIDTSGANDWEAFRVGSTPFLAVANHNNGETWNIKSRIYIFNPATRRFDLFQEIDTVGAADLEGFVIGNTTYLAIAHTYNDQTWNVKSRIFTFGARRRFEVMQELDTAAASHWESFVISQTTNVKSRVYRVQPLC